MTVERTSAAKPASAPQSTSQPTSQFARRPAVTEVEPEADLLFTPVDSLAQADARFDSDFTQIPVHSSSRPSEPGMRFPVIQPKLAIGTAANHRLASSVLQISHPAKLPNALKSGIETLSGRGMNDVTVHYNSSKPFALKALAYTQGSEIHIAPRQERHLPHEAWHVAQQRQGRVRPTLQAKGRWLNTDTALEREADVMGMQAAQMRHPRVTTSVMSPTAIATPVLQRKIGFFGYEDDLTAWQLYRPVKAAIELHKKLLEDK